MKFRIMKNKEKTIVAFFLPTLEGGGAERNVVNLLKGLNKENYKIFLVLGEKKGDFLREVPKEVSIIDLNTSQLAGMFFKLIKYFQKEKPDIFVSAFPRFNLLSLLAEIFSKTRTKIIITEQKTISLHPVTAKTFSHRLIARFLLPHLIRLIYPRANKIVCVSRGVAKDLSKILHLPNKIRVIYNPVVDERIYKLAEEPLNHPWFANSEIPVILATGRLIKAKDYPNLLGAFALILQQRSVHLVILGEGPEKEKLEKIAQRLGIFKNVALLGFQKNPYKYMARAPVFVLSSLHEGFGNVIVEAIACGTPVVSTDCPSGPNEIIENGKSGILVPIGDKKALAEAIVKVLNNSSLRKKFSEEGKKRAQDFSVEKSVKEYEKLFQELLNKNGRYS